LGALEKGVNEVVEEYKENGFISLTITSSSPLFAS
jgi:hypothetical protein